MIREEKNKILFEALSQYLPSKLICHISDGENVNIDRVLTGVTFNGCYFDDSGAFYGWNSFDIKPYLRPMSSITEKEARDYSNCGNLIAFSPQKDYLIPNPNSTHWLNKNHFDHRGLIPMGLGIEVTEKNNPYKD